MSRLKWIGAVTVGLLILCGADKPDFEEFASKEGRFKVLMPGTPKESTEEVRGITLNSFTLKEADGFYGVVYADMPIAADAKVEDLQKLLDSMRDGMLSKTHATLVRESKITLKATYPGREIEVTRPVEKLFARSRLYIVGTRFYQVTVIGTTDYVHSDNATKFLDSLSVTP
jgi:hypothetical protein